MGGDGSRDRIRPGQGHRRRAAAARHLVQARAPRPDDAVGPQRRRQDDAAADARRRGQRRPGRARVRQGRQGRAARSAPAARARPVRCASTCSRARASSWRSRPSWRGSSRRWPAATTTEPTLSRYAEAQARLEHAGGYGWRERALATLHGLGFRDDADLDRPLHTFSGGELTRASLGRALAGDPDLLLLDEPTNHLDIASLEWLEQHLVALDAAVVLVAHDRWFLEAVGTSVLELEAGRGRFFPGPWHAWRQEKAARELALGRAIERQQAEIERLERFVTRFRAGTRARQAQSRAKKLEKIDRIGRGPGRRRLARVRLQAARAQRPGRVRVRGRLGGGRRARRCCTTPSCGSSAASTSRSSAPTARARRR